jgi:hypothetical protein
VADGLLRVFSCAGGMGVWIAVGEGLVVEGVDGWGERV